MLTNPKSIQVLVGTQITKSASSYTLPVSVHPSIYSGRDMLNHHPPKVYDENLGTYTNYDEKYKSVLTASEGLGPGTGFQHVRILYKKEKRITN